MLKTVIKVLIFYLFCH